MIMINYESAWLYTIKARKYICISREFNMADIYLHISSIMFTDYNTYGGCISNDIISFTQDRALQIRMTSETSKLSSGWL